MAKRKTNQPALTVTIVVKVLDAGDGCVEVDSKVDFEGVPVLIDLCKANNDMFVMHGRGVRSTLIRVMGGDPDEYVPSEMHTGGKVGRA